MRRRDFIAIFGGAAAMPVVARANKLLTENNKSLSKSRTNLAPTPAALNAIGA